MPEWQNWAEWHRDAEQSSRVLPPRPDSAEGQLPARVQAMAEMGRPHFQRRYAERLTI